MADEPEVTVNLELVDCGDDQFAVCITNSINNDCGLQMIAVAKCDICGTIGPLNPCERCNEIRQRGGHR